jgi:hypothetical protein
MYSFLSEQNGFTTIFFVFLQDLVPQLSRSMSDRKLHPNQGTLTVSGFQSHLSIMYLAHFSGMLVLR